jgi:hypothetical protein
MSNDRNSCVYKKNCRRSLRQINIDRKGTVRSVTNQLADKANNSKEDEKKTINRTLNFVGEANRYVTFLPTPRGKEEVQYDNILSSNHERRN